MNNKDPLVSIIIPTYNRRKYIEETLSSICQQSYANWECIVVDDGSSDGTETLMQKICSKEGRIKFLKRPKSRLKGGNACRNIGFENSKGDYIHWFDSDDIMHVDNLQHKVDLLEKDRNADYCICNLNFYNETFEERNIINQKEKELNSFNIYKDYLIGKVSILNVTPLWRRSILEESILYDEELKQMQDLDFISKTLYNHRNYCYTNKYLISVRRNNNSITSKGHKIKVNTDAYLNVYKRIVRRTPDDSEITLFSIKVLLWAMRVKMSERNYQNAWHCLAFCLSRSSIFSIRVKLRLWRISIVFFVLRLCRIGDTKLKTYLKL